jgi:type I restriction enzyme S subunit
MGKLVHQDPNDVRDINSLISVANDKDWMFDLPATWSWTIVEKLADLVTDGEHATPTRIYEQQVPLVTAKNVRDGEMDYGVTDWVAYETAEKAWRRCRPLVGDILLVCVGATTGRLCILQEPKNMVLVRSVALIRPSIIVDVNYLALAFRSPLGQNQIWNSVKVTAQPCLYINRINALKIPFPPLAEQHRIVAKVDELMALCDALKYRINHAQTTQIHLADAIVEQAVA